MSTKTKTKAVTATASADIKAAQERLSDLVTVLRRKLRTRKTAGLAIGRILIEVIDKDLIFDSTPINDRNIDRTKAIAKWRVDTFGDSFSKNDYSRFLKFARMVDGLGTKGTEADSFYRSVPMNKISESIEAIKASEVAPSTAADVKKILQNAGIVPKSEPSTTTVNDGVDEQSAQWNEANNTMVELLKSGYKPSKAQATAVMAVATQASK